MSMGAGRPVFTLACFLFAVFIPLGVSADTSESIGREESIERFDVVLEVKPDSTLLVTETIQYHFGPLERHGIFRDIPIEYETSHHTKQTLPIDVVSVENKSRAAYAYTVNRSEGYLHIKIGDPDRLVSGTRDYVIRYVVRGAISFFDSSDELYWNATGNAWPVSIEASSVTVRTERAIRDWQFACYVGPTGSTERCDNGNTKDTGASQDTFMVEWDHPLAAGSGITVALGFPKGLVHEPTLLERITRFLMSNPLMLLPFVVLGFMYRRWYREGRDPKGRGTIVPEYEVPTGLSPLHIAALQDGRLTGKEIPAAIIDLAVQGYLSIDRLSEKKLVFASTDYQLTETTNRPADGTTERELLESLFGTVTASTQSMRALLTSPQAKYIPDFFKRSIEAVLPKTIVTESGESRLRSVKVSDLKNKFYTQIPALQKRVIADLVEWKYFTASPQEVWGKYMLWGVLFFIGTFLLAALLPLQGASVFAIVISIPMYIFFSYLMPRVTREGAIMKERLLGLKDYLRIAEKNRIEFHNAPEKTPALFEKLLPAALLLGVSNIWAKEFADITMREPEWYHSGSAAHFSAVSFASDLGSFNTAAGTTLASAPSGSGSGGGGSSGGGGGGGGGGSW